MIKAIILRFVDNTLSASLANAYRRKRFEVFTSLLNKFPPPMKILDVGGSQSFWSMMEFNSQREIKIWVLNLYKEEEQEPYQTLVGDARDMRQFKDNEFDVVFSNSVIEHVGSYDDQLLMANEVRRVGKRYFLQTPNLYFPIEPHFLFPFSPFFPVGVKVWLLTHVGAWWHRGTLNKQEAINVVSEIRLLRKRELIDLFPDATIVEEKCLGLTKSFMLHAGWDTPSNAM